MRVPPTTALLVCVASLVFACASDPVPATETRERNSAEPDDTTEDPAQYDFAGTPETTPLYAAPTIERARVQRSRRRIILRLRWSPVVDADEYEVQLARNLTFASTRFTKRTRRRSLITPAMRPGLYFLRVRAIGELGDGPWSAAKAIASNERNEEMPRSSTGSRRPSDRIEPPLVSAPPMMLRVTNPAERSLTSAPSLELRGQSTTGATVSVNGAKTVANPDFALTVKLVHGRNDLVVTARRGNETLERSRVVYYADPRRVQSQLAQLRALRQQVDDLRGVQREVRAASKELSGALKGASAGEAQTLRAELDEISLAAEQLDAELEKAFDAVQRLLTP